MKSSKLMYIGAFILEILSIIGIIKYWNVEISDELKLLVTLFTLGIAVIMLYASLIMIKLEKLEDKE